MLGRLEKWAYDVVQGFSPVKNKSSPKGLHYKVYDYPQIKV